MVFVVKTGFETEDVNFNITHAILCILKIMLLRTKHDVLHAHKAKMQSQYLLQWLDLQ